MVMLKNLSRFDANETVFFNRSLETIDPADYMTLFAGLFSRRLIPRVEGLDPYALTYTYRTWEVTGRATIGAPHSNDDGVVGVKASEQSVSIKEIDVSYGWTVNEIKQAAKMGTQLDQLTIQAAMSAVARRIDTILAVGVPGTNITGLLNNANVLSSTPVAKTGGGTAWSGATVKPSEMIADINKIVNETRAALKQASFAPGGDGTPAFDRFVVALPSTLYALIAATPRSDNSDTTILQYILRNNPWLESIEEWWQLDTADAGNPMIVCYPRNPMAVGAIIPREFESLPPQEVGRDIVIPASGTCGGTIIRYPVAVRYMKTV